MFQCFPYSRFFLSRAFCLSGIFRFRQVIIYPLNNSAFLFHLSDIQTSNFQSAMLQHIILDFLIRWLCSPQPSNQARSSSSLPRLFACMNFRQKTHCLYMCTKSKHIPTKQRKYWQYLYSTNTAHASLFPQNISSINFAPH